MKRYQIYLHPQSMDTIDEFEKETGIKRSKIIRSAIDLMAQNLKLFLASSKMVKIRGPLDELVGIIGPRDYKGTDLSERVDEIYFRD